MNYNYESNAFNGAGLDYLNNRRLLDTNSIFNGRMKINSNQHMLDQTGIDQLAQAVRLKSSSTGYSSLKSSSSNDKKLKFSDKLKVLLKYGGNKNEKGDAHDPYAFSDVDSQFGVPAGPPVNMDSYGNRNLSFGAKPNNLLIQKSINAPKSAIPKSAGNGFGRKEDCISEIRNNLNHANFAKMGVPSYVSMSSNLLDSNRITTAEKLKTSSPRSAKSNSSQLPLNNKTFVNKFPGKPSLSNLSLTNLKSASLNHILKSNRNVPGKPQNFGSSQVKHPVIKTEKRPENKNNKNFLKSKSMLNQLSKNTSYNRSVGKPKRTALGKSVSLDSGMPFASNLLNKNVQKKSLLEESLLGLKNNSVHKEGNFPFTNLAKQKSVSSINNRNESLSSLQPGTSTFVPPTNFTLESLGPEKHESLQRIWATRNKLKGLKRDHHHFGLTVNDVEFDENSNSECLLFQNYWFSVSNDYDSLSYHDKRRDTKLSQLKVELRHKIRQLQWRYRDEYRDKMVKLLVDSARKQPNLTALLIRLENSQRNGKRRISRTKTSGLCRPATCSYSDPETNRRCEDPAMPCVRYCQQHITYSNDQLLFTACTALRSDNTTCHAPVLDQTLENPLCLRHKRLEYLTDKPKKLVNAKPVTKTSAPRKRSRSSTGGSSRSGRSRKRKRPPPKEKKEEVRNVVGSSFAINDPASKFSLGKQNDESNDAFRRRNALTEINPQVISKCDIDESQEVEVGEEVLAMAADLPLELATQATRLLEEHDFTNVLNHIPADAFNDLFTEDKEEYEPTPQETEELERALEAVDKDVKSLEKLSQTQGILDTLLDEQTIAQTLAQLPEVSANLEVPPTLVPVFYQNGFANINQLEQTLHDVNKSLAQTVLINPGTDVISNHFVTNLTIPNHADVLQS